MIYRAGFSFIKLCKQLPYLCVKKIIHRLDPIKPIIVEAPNAKYD